jgi:hypothetical protein
MHTACPMTRSGFYCPNSSVEIPCPRGAYCRPESIAPMTCPNRVLTPCPAEGMDAPVIWPEAVVVFLSLVAGVFLALVFVKLMDHSKEHCEFTKAEQDKRAAASRMLRRFIGR